MTFGRLSLIFSRLARDIPRGQAKGEELVPLFLDTILEDSCSEAVRFVFKEAIVEWMKSKGSASC